MAWRIHTIEPDTTNTNYTTIVHHPADVEAVVPLVAQAYGRDRLKLEYKKSPGAREGFDIWDTGILYTGFDPRTIDVVVVLDGGDEDTEVPTVADGTGGGGSGKAGTRKYKAKKLVGFRIGRRNRTWKP